MRQPVEGALALEELNPVGLVADQAMAKLSARDGSGAGGTMAVVQTTVEPSVEPAQEADKPLRGRVKWFDVVKGYGFVTPDDGGDDILIHYNLLAPLGCKALPEGTEILLYAQRGARGRHGTMILNLDFHDSLAGPAGHPSPRLLERLDIHDGSGDFELVEVRWFNRARGYGFLLRDDGVTQIFIHMETVRQGGLDSLHPGQRLFACVAEGPRGPFATAIRP